MIRRHTTRRRVRSDTDRAVRRVQALWRAPAREFRVGGWLPSRAGVPDGVQGEPGGADDGREEPDVPEEPEPDEQRESAESFPYVDRPRRDDRLLGDDRFGDEDRFREDGRIPPDEGLAAEGLGGGGLGGGGLGGVATWGLRRGHLVVIAVLLLVAVGGVGVMVLRDRPVRESVTQRPIATASVVASTSPGATATSASPTPPTLVIHVAGKVRKPGVVRLPAGSRVIDAVSASGGPLNGVDLAALNLARPLADGEQVLVGVTAPPGAPGPGAPLQGGSAAGSAGTGLPATPVNLNTATLEELDTLPGVGPVLGQRIIEFRTSQGGFTSIEELRNVTGIGERTYADLRDRVTV